MFYIRGALAEIRLLIYIERTMQTLHLFPSSIIQTRLSRWEYFKEIYSPFADYRFLMKRPDWNCEVKATAGHPAESRIPWDPLLAEVVSIANTYFDQFAPINRIKLRCDEVWLNRYDRKDTQEAHVHIGRENVLAFAYMVSLPKGSGEFIFVDSRNDWWATTIAPKFLQNPPGTSVTPPCEEGTLLIFPANQQHLVTPHQSDEPRITISGNLQICKT